MRHPSPAVFLSLSGCLLTLILLAGCPSTTAPDIAIAEPVDLGVTLMISRIAGAHAGLPDQWDMRYDAWFSNPTSTDYTVATVTMEHLLGGQPVKTLTIQPVSPSIVKAGATSQLVMVRDDTLYAFPHPSQMRFTFHLVGAGGAATLVKTYGVAEHTNPGPLQAYSFPLRQSDLPAGMYYSQTRHAEDNSFQRWAYDIGAEQWDGSQWNATKPGTDGTHKEDYYIYNRPVYAMSDGLLIGCNRGAVDNDPGSHIGNVPGGNLFWVRTGGTETTLYAHLNQNSIPFNLCPFSDDQQHKLGDPINDSPANDPYRVHAGDLLGHTGASGWSEAQPHLHIHTYEGLPAIWGGSETGLDADARPLEFVNVRVQERASGNVDPALWNELASRKMLPYYTRISPEQ